MKRLAFIATSFAALFVSVLASAQDYTSRRLQVIPPAAAILAHNGMVVAQESRAARVGVEILDRGGNAVDAAVAVGFALAVTYPRAGNLGGGGFMVIHLAKNRNLDNRDVAIDYRETAPAAATPAMFLDAKGNPDPKKSRESGLSVGVPGTVAGLALAREKYGSGKIFARRADGAGDRSRAKRYSGGRRHCRFSAPGARKTGALAVLGEHFPQWRRAAAGRQPADPVRSRGHFTRHCARRPARLLPGPHRRRDRRRGASRPAAS